ncbi:MAG: hypothetical protein ACRYGP_18945 [Janthinobacterium lividum]
MDQATTRMDAEQAVQLRPRDTGALTPDPAIVDPAEHNVVFTSLVTADDDIVGLVAYSIYKQNKYDWLQAFGRLEGRMPDAAEAQSYLLGESTARRLATYRHLAQAVLDGRGPEVIGTSGGVARNAAGRPAKAGSRAGLSANGSGFQLSAAGMAGILVALLVVVVLFWFLHSGAPLPPATPGK